MLATLAGAGLAQWLRVPNAFILGSLAVAIPLTAAGVHLSSMPSPLSNAGQCLLGCTLGSRFEPDFLRGAPRFIGAGGDDGAGRDRDGGAVRQRCWPGRRGFRP